MTGLVRAPYIKPVVGVERNVPAPAGSQIHHCRQVQPGLPTAVAAPDVVECVANPG